MKQETMNLIVHTANSLGLQDVSPYDGYSGRGMYGKTTCGVTGSESDIQEAIIEAVSQLAEEAGSSDDESLYDRLDEFKNDVNNLSQDSMGLDIIKY